MNDDMTQVTYSKGPYSRAQSALPNATIHQREHCNCFEARLAVSLIERWGMITGHDSGEDSTGRSVLALMPVDDVVSRACEIAAATKQELRKRGWLLVLPELAIQARLAEEAEERAHQQKETADERGA